MIFSPLTKDKILYIKGVDNALHLATNTIRPATFVVHCDGVLSAVQGLRAERFSRASTADRCVGCGLSALELSQRRLCRSCTVDKWFPAFTSSCSSRNTEETSDGDKYVDCQEQTGTLCSQPTSSVSDRAAVRTVDEPEQGGSDSGEKSGTSLDMEFVDSLIAGLQDLKAGRVTKVFPSQPLTPFAGKDAGVRQIDQRACQEVSSLVGKDATERSEQCGDTGELSLGGQSSDVDALSDVKDAPGNGTDKGRWWASSMREQKDAGAIPVVTWNHGWYCPTGCTNPELCTHDWKKVDQ